SSCAVQASAPPSCILICRVVMRIMALVIAAAAILLSARTARMWLSASAIPATMPVDTLEHWRPIAAAGHWIGDAESEATVIMFSDYQSGYCASTDERLRRMVATSEGRLGKLCTTTPDGQSCALSRRMWTISAYWAPD